MTWGHHRLHEQIDLEAGIRVIPDQDAWTQVYGIDGEVVHVRSRRYGGRVTLALNQATALNRDMVVRLLADAATGVVVAPLFVIDRQSGFGWSAPVARLNGLPESSMAIESQAVVWTFLCPQLIPLALPGTVTGPSTDFNALVAALQS